MSWRCQAPEVIKQPGGDARMVMQCGHCLGCETRWRKGWVLRMMLEAESAGHVSFLTLTYTDGEVPESLRYSDVSGFLKRLRENSQSSVRFFCVGEYGDLGDRPHWHLIVFSRRPLLPDGLSFPKEWPYGGVTVGAASPAGMAYVAGYSLKKRQADIKPVMSRRPGLGLIRLAQLGLTMAESLGTVEVFPTVIRMGRHLYPLHRRARDVMQEAYVAAGGTIVRAKRLGVSMEAEAILALRSGQWSEQTKSVERAFNKAEIRRLERGFTKARAAVS